MLHLIRNRTIIVFFLLYTLLFISAPSLAQFTNQHDVPFIVSALQSPLSQEYVNQARAIDDQLLTTGEVNGERIYLVTDDRSQRVNTLVSKLLTAMGENDKDWVVRVLDTNPESVNAFVYGGKYIYVYTGLIKEASSDDELAVVLGHELGHSLLKHHMRSQQDATNQLTQIAEMIAAIASKKAYKDVKAVTEGLRAEYNRTDEEEADALGVAIAWRAGFDPLRGADFSTRGTKKSDSNRAKNEKYLQDLKADYEQEQANCQSRINAINQVRARRLRVKPQFVNETNFSCKEAERKRLTYNQTLTNYELQVAEQKVAEIYSSHPGSQNRVGAMAAITDYLKGRRDLNSLQPFEQSYRVMVALKEMKSILLKRPDRGNPQPKPTVAETPISTNGKSLSEELRQLKVAMGQGLISEEEYKSMRQKLLDRY